MRKSSIITIGVMLFLITGMAVKFFVPSNNNKVIVREREINFQVPVNESKPQTPEPESVPAPKITDIFVYVTGEVNNPGVYKLSSDARIFQAIEMAGGFTAKADQASINLAEHMIDGLQLDVMPKGRKISQAPRAKSQPRTVNNAPVKIIQANPPKVSASSTKQTGKVDINNASEQELTQLKGVGPAIAKRIIEYRNAHGRFSKPDDLLGVRGIGEKTLEKMRAQILIR